MQDPRFPRGRIKGAVVRDVIAWYEHKYGRSRLVEAVEMLPAEFAAEFDVAKPDLGVLPSDWFPAHVVHAILDHTLTNFTEPAYEEFVQNAAAVTVKMFKSGVQRIVFSALITPRTYLKVANLAFRLNYEEGKVLNEEIAPKRHLGHVEGWIAHHPFLCRMNVAIKAEMYGVMGFKGVRVEEQFCRMKGDRMCGSIIGWN